MKKTLVSLFAIAASVAAVVSCSKEASSPVQDNQLIKVTLIAGNPEAHPATKTEMNGTNPLWSVGDKIGVTAGTGTDQYEFSTGITSASESASFTGSTVSGNLYAYYPYSNNGVTEDGRAKVDLPANQSPKADSFDGAADLMVAKSFTVDPENTTVENLEFARLGAIVKIVLIDKESTMTGTQYPTSVSMTAASNLAGRVYLDMPNQELDEIYYNPSKTVTANYTSETKYAVNGTNATYLIVYPQTLAEGSTLTIAASTADYSIEKNITVPAGGIELLPGKINTLKINLSASHIISSAGAALPFNDDMSWANNGSSDSNTDISSSIASADNSNGLYTAATKAYKGKGGLKLGTGSSNGSVTTKELDLSGAFYIAIEGGQYVSDAGTLEVTVDETKVITGANIAGLNYVNIPAGTYTKKSKVIIATSAKRGYIYSVDIASGAYVAPPLINVTTDNPMAVANTASSSKIEYTIDNSTTATLTAALKNPADTWISNIDYSTDGEVSFDVAAQATGDPARSAVIVLSYTGADDVEVQVNQAAGAGGITTKTLTIASGDVVSQNYGKYETTDWIITFGGNNKSVGTNSGNRSKCVLSNYSKYAVSPVTTSSIASAFASKTSISNVSKISYTFSGGSNQTSTNVYLLYSSNNTTFSKITLTKGTQGAAISSGTEFEFAKCTGYFVVLFEATNTSGAWRIDDVNLTFTYSE